MDRLVLLSHIAALTKLHKSLDKNNAVDSAPCCDTGGSGDFGDNPSPEMENESSNTSSPHGSGNWTFKAVYLSMEKREWRGAGRDRWRKETSVMTTYQVARATILLTSIMISCLVFQYARKLILDVKLVLYPAENLLRSCHEATTNYYGHGQRT